MSTLYDTVISDLKGLIGSNKSGVSLTSLDGEYKNLIGQKLPIQQLGFRSVELLIRSVPNLFTIRNISGHLRIFNVIGEEELESNLNLYHMIHNTVPKKKSYKKFDIKGAYNPRSVIDQINSISKNNANILTKKVNNLLKEKNINDKETPLYQRTHNLNNNNYNSTYRNNFTTTNNCNSAYKFDNRPTSRESHNYGFQGNNNFSRYSSDSQSYSKSNGIFSNSEEKNDTHNGRICVVSDSDDENTENLQSIYCQTDIIVNKSSPRSSWSFSSEELTLIIVEILLEYKDFKFYDQKYNIVKELSYYFRKLTGLAIECYLFRDMVLSAIKSPESTSMFRSLAYTDDDKYVNLNLVPSLHTRTLLPDIEFIKESQYHSEIVEITSDGSAALKLTRMDDVNLKWRSSFVKDWVRDLIEGQLFWSWIPASLCLVKLPQSIVAQYNLLEVERAVILTCYIVGADEMLTYRSQHCLLHSASFYLVDHNIELNNILSCGISYQDIKAKSNSVNDSQLAYVSNMSFRARSRPVKVQFMQIKNIDSIMDNLKKMRKNTSSKGQLILYDIENTNLRRNFQAVYKCSAKIDGNIKDFTRTVEHYSDISAIQNVDRAILKVKSKEIVEISSDEEKPTIKSENLAKIHNFKTNNHLKDKNVILISSDEDDDDKINQSNQKNQISKTDCVSVVSYTDEDDIDSTDTNKNEGDKTLKNITINSGTVNSPKSLDLPNSFITSTPKATKPLIQTENSNFMNSNSNTIQTLSPLVSNSQTTPIISQLPLISSNGTTTDIILPTLDKVDFFKGESVKLLSIRNGIGIISRMDSLGVIKREILMNKISERVLAKPSQIYSNKYYIWTPATTTKYFYNPNNRVILVETLKMISGKFVMVSLLHTGQITTIPFIELCEIPDVANKKNNTESYNQFIKDLIGPAVGSFNLHLLPVWFEVNATKYFNTLFTANFINENQLVLEYSTSPGRYLNIDLIDDVEQILTSNPSQDKSRSFLLGLSECLFESRVIIGYFIESIESNSIKSNLDSLLITNTITKVTNQDHPDIWFASIDVQHENSGIYQKLSPNNFMENKFCIDRVYFDKSKNKIVLLDHQNIFIPLSKNMEGLYKFDKSLVKDSFTSKSEFYSRYMLCCGSQIPDLSFLFNKLLS